jgi:hypothetical protein
MTAPNKNHPFLDEWAHWTPKNPPYVFPGDEPAIGSLEASEICVYHTWAEYSACSLLDLRDDHRLHLGLLPHPFAGDPLTARIIILMLNPGLSPLDAFAELTQPQFRDAMLRNLRREFADRSGFPFLDPQLSWHGAFGYWHGKLRQVIRQLAGHWALPYTVARERLAAMTATIELVPYHSPSFAVRGKVVESMKSVQLARTFVRKTVLERARAGDCIILVTRQAKRWGLEEEANVVVYGGGEAQAAHLTPQSRGGQRILELVKSLPT